MGNWLTSMVLSDVFHAEPAASNEQVEHAEKNHEVQLPEVLGILPIRNTVAFPGTVMPLGIGRDKSKKLIEDIVATRSVLGLLTQRNADTEDPAPKHLYAVGTVASVLKVVRTPGGGMQVIVHGIMRFRVKRIISTSPYVKAEVEYLQVHVKNTKKLAAMVVNLRNTANRVIQLSPNVPEEASLMLENIEDPSALADFLAANLSVSVAEKQSLLEEVDAGKRLARISLALAGQLEVLELSNKIHGQVKESIEKSQRELFLQEQLKAIEDELGHKDRQTEEINELRIKIKKARMPREVEAEAIRELDRMSRIPQISPEYGVSRTYLDWMCEMPWSVRTEDNLDIRRAERILNRDHYGLKKIKRRILEFLAVRKLNPAGKSPILCFVGPPGVGKTSLGQSIARAMGRKFVRISLGGIRDEADIRGHRRTYIGALPGRILQELRKCKSRNPVFMLDELDKIGQDFRGDPASALLEVLDPAQNFSFTDHYIDQPFDLSEVMFIGTANYSEPVPPALIDRMEVIELPGYTQGEKLRIAQRYLIPRQLKEHGLTPLRLKIEDSAIVSVINDYTREAGVRNLERDIAAICRAVGTDIAKGTKRKATVGKAEVARILGPIRFESEVAMRTTVPGVVTGLAYTPNGGEILFIECAMMPGKGDLQLTGHIGEVMKESARAAFTVVKANAKELGIDARVFSRNDFHIHVPEGAVPKDGPSAGIGMLTSLVSRLTNRKVRPDVAMTGEITLQGLVLPIGGLKEKILAAKRAGIKTVIVPARNKKDIPEVPAEARSGMKFVYVREACQVLKSSLAAG
jgi:ATP-dependent Lon protease